MIKRSIECTTLQTGYLPDIHEEFLIKMSPTLDSKYNALPIQKNYTPYFSMTYEINACI